MLRRLLEDKEVLGVCIVKHVRCCQEHPCAVLLVEETFKVGMFDTFGLYSAPYGCLD